MARIRAHPQEPQRDAGEESPVGAGDPLHEGAAEHGRKRPARQGQLGLVNRAGRPLPRRRLAPARDQLHAEKAARRAGMACRRRSHRLVRLAAPRLDDPPEAPPAGRTPSMRRFGSANRAACLGSGAGASRSLDSSPPKAPPPSLGSCRARPRRTTRRSSSRSYKSRVLKAATDLTAEADKQPRPGGRRDPAPARRRRATTRPLTASRRPRRPAGGG